MFRGSIAPIDKCPYCDSEEGYYIKEKVAGAIHFKTKFDGTESDNSDMYDHLEHKSSKSAYCVNCHKRLFKVSELR
jgi:hypothetical protein